MRFAHPPLHRPVRRAVPVMSVNAESQAALERVRASDVEAGDVVWNTTRQAFVTVDRVVRSYLAFGRIPTVELELSDGRVAVVSSEAFITREASRHSR